MNKKLCFNDYEISFEEGKYCAKKKNGEEWKSEDGFNWMRTNLKINDSVRSHNVGKSDYSKHKIQPWDIWIEYKLNPFDADIVKRILRKKAEPGMTEQESRKMDYEKIIHICQERIRQIDKGIEL